MNFLSSDECLVLDPVRLIRSLGAGGASEDVVGQLGTGDVLFFSGDNSLDEVIQLVEGEPYTHLGLVINNGSDLWFWDAPGGGDRFEIFAALAGAAFGCYDL